MKTDGLVEFKTKTTEGLVQVVNEEGELLKEVNTQKVVKYVANGEDEFLRCYALFIHAIHDTSSISEVKVMAELFWRYGDGRQFSITDATRTEIAEKIRISKSSFVSSLAQLVDKKIVHKIAHNTYFLNPMYAFNRSTEKRREAITFMINIQGDVVINN